MMPPSVAQRMPMYPPAPTGLGQQLFYGQGPPPIIPPQAAFGYQHQLVPGLRPGGAPLPNFFVPMVQQGQQHGQRPAGRRTGQQQPQQPMQMMRQQQLLPRGHYRQTQARGPPEAPAGSMYEIGGGMTAALSPHALGSLASLLADASPDTQRLLLGENLYPLVEQLEPEMAAKVTGMLLEMDQTEVLNLLESPDALKAKVAEAMEVLRNVSQQQQLSSADQLARLSLN